jgi:ABC-type Fe3+ transport system substrate-binding protein
MEEVTNVKRKHLTGAVSILAVALVSTACGAAAPSPSATAAATTPVATTGTEPTAAARTVDDVCTDAAGTTVDYYGSGDPPDQAEINAAFNATYPDITVTFINSRTNESVTKVLTEDQAGRAPEVDIVTGNMADQLPLFEAGLVADLPLKELGLQETKIYEVGGVEVVRLKRKFGGLMYNTQTMTPDELPDTWEGLLDANLNGKFMSDPRGIYLGALRMVKSQADYESFIDSLVETTDPVLVTNTSAQIQKVLTGEFVTGDGGQDSDIFQQAAEGAPIGIKYLNVLTTFDIFGTILDKAADKDAAVCYVHWLNSPDGLKALADVEFKANDDLPPAGMPAGAVIAEAVTEEELQLYGDASAYYADKLEGQTSAE